MSAGNPLTTPTTISLKGKVAIVTGASSGIGYNTALRLAADGASVVVGARRVDRLNELVKRIETSGGKALAVVYDASKEADAENIVKKAVEKFGRLDIAFNNAGIGVAGQPIVNSVAADVDNLWATNMRSIVFAMKYQIPAMIASGANGSIINNGSTVAKVSARTDPVKFATYAASKAFVHAITKAAAIEARGKVRVNAVAPGIFATDIFGDDAETKAKGIAAGVHLIPRPGKLDELAQFVSYLGSDNAAFITGGIHFIDGGSQLL